MFKYSGDVDGRIPVTSSRYSIKQLQVSVKTQWQPWFINTDQVNLLSNMNHYGF